MLLPALWYYNPHSQACHGIDHHQMFHTLSYHQDIRKDYKHLLETVTEGYIALNENFFTQDVEWKLNQYKEKDSYNLQNSEDIPTFEKAHKIGAIENIKSSSKKCHNKLIYWDSLIGTGKLQVIFGYKKMKALENAINEEYKQLNIEMQETVFENKGFNYNKSYAHLIQYPL